MAQNPLVSFGDLGKPVNTLIERVSDAVGGLTRPWQIRRVAGAEAEAAVIRAVSESQITELQRDVFCRFLEREAIKQGNEVNILLKAIPNVDPNNAKPEDVTGDWFANFFDKCRIVSDEDMQQLWARILAGEANNPGSFSRQTVNLAADLDKKDAVLFSSLCRFAGAFFGAFNDPLIFDWEHEVYNKCGIHFDSACQLESLGLIHISQVGEFSIRVKRPGLFCFFSGRVVHLSLLDDNKDLQIGHALFTKAGRELLQVCTPEPVDGFFEYVYDRWAGQSLVPPRS